MPERKLISPRRANAVSIFDVRLHAGPDYVVLTPVGELDLLTVPQLEELLERFERRTKLLVLDLRGLTFASAAGMKAVLDAHTRSQAHEGVCLTLVLQRTGPVRRAFELAGLADRLPFTTRMPAWASSRTLAASPTTPRAA
jgi:anti-anti-sigma factor